MTMSSSLAGKSGTFRIGEHVVNRLGFGTMRLPGDFVWGEPKDRTEAINVLRRAVELGVNLIDTADVYGPFVAEQLIAEALHPYPDDLIIATKAGMTRSGPNWDWGSVGRPEYLRQQALLSLRHLKLERIPLLQLHRIDPQVPVEDSIGELVALQKEGLVEHIGVSEVTVEQLEVARSLATVVTVQNAFNLVARNTEPVLDYCTVNGIGFIPYFPLAVGELAGDDGPLADMARRRGVASSQIALAWLLKRSPVMLPIPGTSNVAHLEDNLAAAEVKLSQDEFDELDRLVARK